MVIVSRAMGRQPAEYRGRAIMPGQNFGHHPNYSQLLSGAHRKPATIVNTPTLICHLVFWQPLAPQQKDGGGTIIESVARDKWKEDIDQYLKALYSLLRDESAKGGNYIRGAMCQNTDHKDFEKSKYIFLLAGALDLEKNELVAPENLPNDLSRDFVHDYQSIVFGFIWHHTLVKLRFELHHEYLSLTSFVDLSTLPKRDDTPISVEDARTDVIYSMLYDNLMKMNEMLVSGTEDDQEFSKLHRCFYNTIWHFLIKELLLTRNPIGGPTLEQRAAQIGDVIADFRGLVLTRPRPPKSGKLPDFFQMTGWRNEAMKRDFTAPTPLNGNEGARILQSFWPFVTSDPRIPFKEYELTASRMLGGRAVYLTALGAQPALYQRLQLHGEEGGHVPLYYLLYSHTVRHWQIGRLIDRIHQQGTLRIAAIHELEKLRDASIELRQISQTLDRRAERLAISSPTESDKAESLFKSISEAQNKIAGISIAFSGGFLYRVERSRYYVKQFRDGLPALRIRRIEGFQPYDVFVERRLGATFDFIDRLGRRYERLESHINSFYQFFLAHNGISISSKIESRNEKIQEIQTVAEVFFLMIPAPYYAISIYEHTLGAHGSTAPSHQISSQPAAVPAARSPISPEGEFTAPATQTTTNTPHTEQVLPPSAGSYDTFVKIAIFLVFALAAIYRYVSFKLTTHRAARHRSQPKS